MGLLLSDFLPISGFKDYFISSSGHVLSRKGKSEKILHPSPVKDGYLMVSLLNGKKYMRLVHRLVAEAFVPKSENKDANYVCHKNGNILDNRAANLYWGTQRDNMRDAAQNLRRGETHPKSKLNEEKVRFIRKNYGALTLEKLGHMFGVSGANIHAVVTGKTWN